VKVIEVRSNHAKAEAVERLPMEDDGESTDEGEETESGTEDQDQDRSQGRPAERERLGSRDNFWGGD